MFKKFRFCIVDFWGFFNKIIFAILYLLEIFYWLSNAKKSVINDFLITSYIFYHTTTRTLSIPEALKRLALKITFRTSFSVTFYIKNWL